MANRNPNNVAIGDWYTMCCILDLNQIKDEETLDYVKSDLQTGIDDPSESWGINTWKTLNEAALELMETEDDKLENIRPDLVA